MSEQSLESAIENCEKEPIHIPGSVQSHGILLTLRSSDFTILQISESVFNILGVHHSELLHQPLSKLMPIESVERATKRLGDRTPRLLNPIPLEVVVRGKAKKLDGILHRSGRVLILELEEHVAPGQEYGGFGGFYEAIREVSSRLMVTENLSEVLELGCQELRKLTGFDRVLAYKFDEDWNGEVVNESKSDNVESLLHHHFPASDIPKQARELYTTNWLRIIPNVNYRPSPIVPSINPITDNSLDLSNSVLRSVSPVHLEYMRNMGQFASMSVSLLKGKKLWGLISCHHSQPHFLQYDVRVASEFIGQMISAQIVAREDASQVDHKLQLKKLYDDLLKTGLGYPAIQKSFAENASSLLGLVDAQGAALCFNQRIICVGATPDYDFVTKLRDFALTNPELVIVTESLGTLPGFGGMTSVHACGMICIKLNAHGTRDCVIWFRPEQRSRSKWAGNPSEAKTVSADGRIKPRKSFETWLENAAGRATKWKAVEIDAAIELRASLNAMLTGYTKVRPVESPDTVFIDSLTSSIATTAATKESREPSANEMFRSITEVEIAQNSRLLLEGFSEFAVLFLDVKGSIQNWSAGAKRLLGYSRPSVIGKDIQMFFPEEEILKERHNRILAYARDHGRSEEELWLYRADQTSFWAKIMVSNILNDENQSVGFSIVIQDVTKEKMAEEELKSTKASAEAANHAKTAFMANVSHEIRTPLGAVLGFSELLMAEHLSREEKLDLYARVKRNGEQLTVLINDLLDIGKVESGKIEVESLLVDLRTLLNDIAAIFSLKASERGVLFKIVLGCPIPITINSDPTRLRQILINLLSNAIKFTKSGGSVTLTVSPVRMAECEQIAFKVSDTGRGMTEAQMEKLFRPFVQADVTTTRVYGGTGLGLYLSQRLARALGGDLSIESSEPNKGTSFLAHIDPGHIQGIETFVELNHLNAPTTFEPLNSSVLHEVRVLVVDDSRDNRDLINTYLRRAGAIVRLAENGRQGVEMALEGEVDLVLMDIQMPVLDGNQAMKKLVEAGFQKPVIALTAHAMREERDHSLGLGFSDYLTKPIDRVILIDRIRQLACLT